MRKIEVLDYSVTWPTLFVKEKQLIEPIVEHLQASIHHIGSTSVPRLAAKPIIDILIEVDNLAAIDQLNETFLTIGYVARGENGIAERRYFEKGGEDRTHQIHTFLRGSENAIRHLAFRDYLRQHPDVAKQYAQLKKNNAQACHNNIEIYCDLKNEFVQFHEQQAMKWYNKQ